MIGHQNFTIKVTDGETNISLDERIQSMIDNSIRRQQDPKAVTIAEQLQ